MEAPFNTKEIASRAEEGRRAAARLSERNWRQQKSHIEGEGREAGRSFNEVLGLKWSQEISKALVILVPVAVCGFSNKRNKYFSISHILQFKGRQKIGDLRKHLSTGGHIILDLR